MVSNSVRVTAHSAGSNSGIFANGICCGSVNECEWAYLATGVQIELRSKMILGDTFRVHYVHIQLNNVGAQFK
jgi:hypothetical protein